MSKQKSKGILSQADKLNKLTEIDYLFLPSYNKRNHPKKVYKKKIKTNQV